MSKIYFFRHAQASFMADNYDQLSAKGEKQSEALGNFLFKKNLSFDKIYVGNLERQKKTFEIVNSIYQENNSSLPNPTILPQLNEHSGPEALKFAVPDLIVTNELCKKWAEEIKVDSSKKKRNNLLLFQYFMNEWSQGKIKVDHSSIESWKTFRQRVSEGLNNILTNTGRGETIGVFTSGGTISAIVGEALGIKDETKIADLNFSFRNTSITKFLFSKNIYPPKGWKFNILSMNEVHHLEEKMITFV